MGKARGEQISAQRPPQHKTRQRLESAGAFSKLQIHYMCAQCQHETKCRKAEGKERSTDFFGSHTGQQHFGGMTEGLGQTGGRDLIGRGARQHFENMPQFEYRKDSRTRASSVGRSCGMSA